MTQIPPEMPQPPAQVAPAQVAPAELRLAGEAAPPAPPPGPADKAREALEAGKDELTRYGRIAAQVLRWLGPQRDPEAPPPTPRELARAAWRLLVPSNNPLEQLAPRPDQGLSEKGRLLELANTYPLPTWRLMARSVMLMTLFFIVWANFAALDEVAIAEGEVVPEGKVKTVQHLEGGIIREIYVTEGVEVKEGHPLVQLDLAITQMNPEEMRVRLDGLALQRARLESELRNSPLALPAEEAKRQPALAEAERRSYEARRQALKSTLAVLSEQMRGKTLEVQELQTKERSISTSLRLSHQRFEMSKDLARSGLTSRMEHVQMEAQVEELAGQLAAVRASIPRAQAAISEVRQRIEEEEAKYQRTAQQEMAEAELNIARNRELLTQVTDQQRRTQITAPLDGIVKNLRYNTIGGVVKPGDPIMEIVPLHEQLQVEAKLNPADRGYVQLGQRATVKLSAYDYTTYGGLDGEVILVAPDTTMGPNNTPYYRVMVRTDKSYLGDEGSKRIITAGMQATTEIHTGTRTVMEFLVKPVLKLRHEAFRER